LEYEPARAELDWNADKVRETIAYIKGAIDRGLPVFVGVLWPVAPGGWRVTTFQAVDDAIDDPVRSFPTFDVTRDSIRKPANDVDHGWAADGEYQLTQVRVCASDVEQAKTASAWWN